MVQFGSFVFFDLGTTRLPKEESITLEITELSLVACSKEHLLAAECNGLPRVLHKLTVSLKPEITLAVNISAHTKDLLKDEAVFDENMIQLIELFLDRLQKPIGLVAHNGDRFDFIILQNKLQALYAALGWNAVPPSDTVYSIDSLPFLRAQDQHTPGHKLEEIYKRLFSKAPETVHRAEADAITLLKCIVHYKSKFVEFAETNTRNFGPIPLKRPLNLENSNARPQKKLKSTPEPEQIPGPSKKSSSNESNQAGHHEADTRSFDEQLLLANNEDSDFFEPWE